tara:strand:+ start:4287 stop:5969 length:1683 start_codon:yes stop_codon:yes gene_type:complete
MIKKIILIFFSTALFSQNINLNNEFINSKLRYDVLNNKAKTNHTLNIFPIEYETLKKDGFKFDLYENEIFSNKKNNIKFKFLGIDYFLEYNSKHPYNRNNGSMIPNRGYQHVISPGFYFKLGPLSIKLKPEHHYSENKNFDGFWEGHYPVIWANRYRLWNHIDMPERFGEIRHNRLLIGQSSISINFKKLRIGVSNENLWWGPSIRNSIMMSNHAEGFKHITFNTTEPIKTFIGNFEWQIITGRLESSGFTPPNTDFEYSGTKIYVPKINQLGKTGDWRYLQGFIFSYSPKWIDGLSLGLTRWAQMYSALIEGKYFWMIGEPTYFPAFANFFRENDKYQNYEEQTNQAAGIFMNWHWDDAKARIYAEFYHNDSKQNFRDFLLDSDHSRAATVGISKIFEINNNNFIFNWEWTQMEQTAGRMLRNAGSWYSHNYVYDGYTNRGEVIGSSIGPGSNSQYFSLNKINENSRLGVAIEIVDNDNDFYYEAFDSANDYRRYWKDINFHLNYNKKFKNFQLSSNFIFIRSLNYQWELDDFAEPYYHPGRDVNNLHLSLKFTYFGNW